MRADFPVKKHTEQEKSRRNSTALNQTDRWGVGGGADQIL